MEVKVSKTQKFFTDENGRRVDYTERLIIVDGIEYKVNTKDSKVFDLQFKEMLAENEEDN